jgi:hypothetical protein
MVLDGLSVEWETRQEMDKPNNFNVPQVDNWFNTCAGAIYRERMLFLGGGDKLSPMPYQTLAPTKNGLRSKP